MVKMLYFFYIYNIKYIGHLLLSVLDIVMLTIFTMSKEEGGGWASDTLGAKGGEFEIHNKCHYYKYKMILLMVVQNI